jgi:hypothetical protein
LLTRFALTEAAATRLVCALSLVIDGVGGAVSSPGGSTRKVEKKRGGACTE